MILNRKLIAVCTAILIGALSPAHAGGIEREELFRDAIDTCGGTEVIVARLAIAPGAVVPRHSHNGDEHLVVIRGGTMAMPDGKTMDFQPGMALDFPRGFEHGGLTAMGDEPIVLYTVHVVDTDAPLSVAAK